MTADSAVPTPARQGLYAPDYEHDACGVAFVVDIAGRASHDIVDAGLTALRNLEHRGASGSEPDSGDGAGILVQVPDAFFRATVDFALPAPGMYAVGIAFLPHDPAAQVEAQDKIDKIAAEEGLRTLGWRDLSVDPDTAGVGVTARSVMPVFRQLFLGAATDDLTSYALERRAYVARKRAEHETSTYFPSLSARTLVYKGMLTTGQLEPFFPDLSDPRFVSALCLVHSRFSTNTFPSWPLAHPYRYIAHNGEINTVRGNRNWMRAREALLRGPHELPDDLTRLF
ncbi:MAG: gltB1, partial [Frankiales bacterium]|nr:gltB1 [Frankiales bacterium]